MHLLERSTSEGQGLDCHLSSLVASLPALLCVSSRVPPFVSVLSVLSFSSLSLCWARSTREA